MNNDRIHLALTREETGTLLGTIAWVIGALEIMRDRGHADADEELHDLHDRLAPRLERLLERITRARQDAAASPRLETEVEEAYAAVRRAFEMWIELTAVDTLSAAVAERLAGAQPSPDTGAEGSGDPDTSPGDPPGR